MDSRFQIQIEVAATGIPHTVGRYDDRFLFGAFGAGNRGRTDTERLPQSGFARSDLEGFEPIDAPQKDLFGIAVQTQRIVAPRRNDDRSALAADEFVTQTLTPVFRKQIETHGLGFGIGRLSPIENDGQVDRMRMVVAKFLVRTRNEQEHRPKRTKHPFHRLPPFFSLRLPAPISQMSDISALVGPNQCRRRVDRQT